jgi:hypothetical protein
MIELDTVELVFKGPYGCNILRIGVISKCGISKT